MTILIFIIILGVLVLVHELGHFIFAKKAKVRVDEFGFGYPPRAFKIGRRWNTDFTLNWIPFGGFVKILGENYESKESDETKEDQNKFASFRSKLGNLHFTEISKKWQAMILFAGVLFNFIFAWILFSTSFMFGIPMPKENDFGLEVKNPQLTIIGVMKDSPAEKVGIKTGDKISSVSFGNKKLEDINPESFIQNISQYSGETLIKVSRGDEFIDFKVIPKEGIVKGKRIIGVNVDEVGIASLSIHKSIIYGAKSTFKITYLTTIGIVDLFVKTIKGKADLSGITGPIGIVGLVGDASKLGFVYILSFTALISINLAVINLLPLPALDGGRLLFVAIEAITRKPINPKIASSVNGFSFAFLVILMIIITYRDIVKLF